MGTSCKQGKRLLFLYANTGGGHRSVARAVERAVRGTYGNARIQLVDVLEEYAPWPFCQLDHLYPYMTRMKGWPWAIGYHLSNGARRADLIFRSCWPLVRESAQRLLRDHPADVIVCCHYLFNYPILNAVNGTRTPVVTVVTDFIASHAFWFSPGATRYLVPTPEARNQAQGFGIPEGRVSVVGLPVDPEFVSLVDTDPAGIRRKLGLLPDLPVVLVVGGAEGMGPLKSVCEAIAATNVRAQLAVITGRNEEARADLAEKTWSLPVRIEGFVENMHEWMRAADLLVTKAGPSTINEALVLGVPMVLSAALPGHERRNVDFVVEAGAGIYAPTPEKVGQAVLRLLGDGAQKVVEMSRAARSLARPDAAWNAAEIIMSLEQS